MQKLLNFLLIVLIFTVLQVTNVGAQDTLAPGSVATGQMDQDCAAIPHSDGSSHVDPPQDIISQVEAEYKANCQSGNCFLGEGNYGLLEGMGHTRAEVDCFLAEGEKQHNEQHGGMQGNHGGMPGMTGGPGGMQGNHGGMPGMTGGPGGMQGNHGGMQGNHGGMPGMTG